MMRSTSRLALAVLAGMALSLAAVTPAGAQATSAFKCNTDLWKSFKTANFVEKFVGKCNIDVIKRQNFLIGEKGKGPDALIKSAELCETFVGSKALAQVASALGTGNCGDDDLRAMSRPDKTTFGESTAQLLQLEALRDGLRRSYQVNPNLYTNLATAGADRCSDSSVRNGEVCEVDGDCVTGVCDATACPSCNTLRNGLFGRGIGPCATSVCSLGLGSSTTLFTGAVPIPTTVSGSLAFDVCRWSPAMTNEDFGLFGSATRTLSGTLGALTVCIDGAGASGWIKADASAMPRPSRNTEFCQDHLVTGTCDVSTTVPCSEDTDCPGTETCTLTDTDECISGGADLTDFSPSDCTASAIEEGQCSTTTLVSCIQDADCPVTETCVASFPATDPHPGTGNGGICFQTTAATNTAGDAFMTLSLATQLATDAGVDGDPCTADDGSDPGVILPITLTTNSSDTTVYDAQAIDATVISRHWRSRSSATELPDPGLVLLAGALAPFAHDCGETRRGRGTPSAIGARRGMASPSAAPGSTGVRLARPGI